MSAPAEGVDPRWVRRVTTTDPIGTRRTWYVLDNRATLAAEPVGTLLCVHGNPTSSYLWRHVVAAAGRAEHPWRVVAMDQLNMGWSERTGVRRRLATRLDDLDRLTDALELDGPVVTLGHDWGGAISLGWAGRHPERLAGVAVLNTAVHQPPGSALPFLIAAARLPGVRRFVTATTPVFLQSTLGIAHPWLPAPVRAGYLDPYRSAERRSGIDEFVEDIPVDPTHPSWPALESVVAGLPKLANLPALMLWGPRDPVFTDLYLRDLRSRLPQAQIHRFEKAGHLVAEDAPVADAVVRWLEDVVQPSLHISPSDVAGMFGPTGTAGAPEATDVATGRDAAGWPILTGGRGTADGSDTAGGRDTLDEPGTAGRQDSAGGQGTAGGQDPASGQDTADGQKTADAYGAGYETSVTSTLGGPRTSTGRRELWAPLDERADDPRPVLLEACRSAKAPIGSWRATSWRQLAGDVNRVAAGLLDLGVRPGDRVALLVPPGADLTVALYACLRIGAVGVIADAGLGVPGLHRAIRGAAVRHVIAIDRGLLAARALRWTGSRIGVGVKPGSKVYGVSTTLDELRRSAPTPLPPAPAPEAEALVLFTSGSTGPAKGVVYTYRQVEAIRDALLAAYQLRSGHDDPAHDDRFVAAFAPFALFGPGLGITSAVPDMDVTAPRTLSATALDQAVRAVDATVVFASPAALENVLATAGPAQTLPGVRLLLSAGAPVPAGLLTRLQRLLPSAELHTPYGMTEALLLTDVDLTELASTGPGDGVLVGKPLPGVEIVISPLDERGRASVTGTTVEPGVTGEIVVRARHLKERYDQLWLTQKATSTADGRHRTGDVGHFDADGRLWVEGRLVHVLSPAGGFVTPVGVEQRIESVPGVRRAALVGIGETGGQHLVAVLESADAEPGVAPLELAAAVRVAAGVELVAVLVTKGLKTDIRHNSKIDRTQVGEWAARRLAGSR